MYGGAWVCPLACVCFLTHVAFRYGEFTYVLLKKSQEKLWRSIMNLSRNVLSVFPTFSNDFL